MSHFCPHHLTSQQVWTQLTTPFLFKNFPYSASRMDVPRLSSISSLTSYSFHNLQILELQVLNAVLLSDILQVIVNQYEAFNSITPDSWIWTYNHDLQIHIYSCIFNLNIYLNLKKTVISKIIIWMSLTRSAPATTFPFSVHANSIFLVAHQRLWCQPGHSCPPLISHLILKQILLTLIPQFIFIPTTSHCPIAAWAHTNHLSPGWSFQQFLCSPFDPSDSLLQLLKMLKVVRSCFSYVQNFLVAYRSVKILTWESYQTLMICHCTALPPVFTSHTGLLECTGHSKLKPFALTAPLFGMKCLTSKFPRGLFLTSSKSSFKYHVLREAFLCYTF